MKKLLVLIGLVALSGCSVGAHVDVYTRQTTHYACYYTDSVFRMDRRIAVCETALECNAICSKLAKP